MEISEKCRQEKETEKKSSAVKEPANHHSQSCDAAGTNEDALIQADVWTALTPDPSNAMYYTADDLCRMWKRDGDLCMSDFEDLMFDELEEMGFQDDGTLYDNDGNIEFSSYSQKSQK